MLEPMLTTPDLDKEIRVEVDAERGKRRFNCDEQKVNSSGSSPQLRAKGSEGRMAERDDKKD